MPSNSYVISRNEIEYYLGLMRSLDTNIQREGVQGLYQEISKGRFLSPYSKVILEDNLAPMLTSSEVKVRKWAFHLATEVNSYKIVSICREQLRVEENEENVNWIIAVLSTVYNRSDLRGILKSDFSYNILLTNIKEIQIEASTALFSMDKDVRSVEGFVQDLRKSEPGIRSWLTKFYGYQKLAKDRGLDKCVSQKDMLELITDGDLGLQEYGMWGLCLHREPELEKIPKDLLDYEYYSMDAQKWFFQFIECLPEKVLDYNFLLSLIDKHSQFNRSAKEGLMHLLLKLQFHRKFVEGIVKWYIVEKTDSVKRLLLGYMVKNVKKDTTTTFFCMLDNEFQNPELRLFIECEIRFHPNSDLMIENDRLQEKVIEGEMNNYFFGEVKDSTFIEKVDNYNTQPKELVRLMAKMISLPDNINNVPKDELSEFRENLERLNTQIQAMPPKKNILQKSLNGVKKFVQEFSSQFLVSLATSHVSELDWQRFIEWIEMIITQL